MNEFINDMKNKKIVVLGLGREGKTTYKLLRKYLKDETIDIIDENKSAVKDFEIINNTNVIITSEYIELLNNYDVIFKSPGISFKGKNIESFKEKIMSQLEVFLKYFKNCTTIGITGTKGKSTTSTLIYEIIKAQNENVELIGNIGVPVFEIIEKLEKLDYVVIEMSSHQLEYMEYSPNIAIVLNVYEEHLDHYNSFDEYANAKLNIAKYQNANEYFIYNQNNEVLAENVERIAFKSNVITMKQNEYYEFDFAKKRNLIGEHNETNIKFALEVAKILNLDMDKVEEVICNFKTLEHRMEYVGKYNDITYYNDSIATIPEATINCIKALENVNTVLIGGMDRGINYDVLIDYLNNSNVENVICMYSVGEKIYNKLDKNKAILAKNLEEAVSLAKKVTKKNTICVLSPAAASYGYFKNFEERGTIFKKLIKN